MTDYYIKGACTTITGFFSLQSRLVFEGFKEEEESSESSIQYHNFIMAYILRFFNNKAIVSIKDIDENIYHLNRDSLTTWLKKYHQCEDIKNGSNKSLLNVTEYTMIARLDQVLEKRSPCSIVTISQLKNDLQNKEKQKKLGDKHGWNSPGHLQLPGDIDKLKDQLIVAQAERLLARDKNLQV